jgi:CRP-like cAMP-binding protein
LSFINVIIQPSEIRRIEVAFKNNLICIQALTVLLLDAMESTAATLSAFLNKLAPKANMSDEAINELSQITEVVNYQSGSILLKEGEYCKYLFIIQKGFARRYSLEDGKDVTREFAEENELMTSQYSLNTNQPSQDYIETLEYSTILRIKYEDIKKLYATSTEILRIGRFLRDSSYLKLENRIRSLQVSSARERYNKLLKSQPHIIQRATLGHIASYLGMTQENLSRVRRKK